MSPAALTTLSRIGMSCLPGMATAAVGCLLIQLGATWTSVAIGGALALGLALIGALIHAAGAQRDLPVAMAAAMLSFALRIGGVIVASFALGQSAAATITIATLGGCLAATLIIEMLSGWMRVVHLSHASHPTAPQESARA